MTAEIAILNRSAVALAADSAVTIGNKKVYNSVNKLFALSKFKPVGVMVYSNSEMMGIPWETIIKVFRAQLGEKSFPTIQEYADEFLKFLENNRSFFPESEQEKFVESICYHSFWEIRNAITKKIDKKTKDIGNVTIEEIKNITKEILSQYASLTQHNGWKRLRPTSEITDEQLIAKYESVIKEAKDNVFEKLELDNEDSKNASLNVARYCLHNLIAYGETGLVLAGFGDDQFFPSLRSYRIEGIIDNKLKFVEESSTDITNKMNATIKPFAQSEIVYTIMRGIDPKHSQAIDGILDNLGTQASDLIGGILDEQLAQAYKDKEKPIQEAILERLKGFAEQTKVGLIEDRQKSYIDPVIDAVANLPHVELAAMAESLVTITSFKRRITLDQETVGGPVDVAVITKGDGFIWVKRKHYFEPSLNPAFFSNYFRTEGQE